MALKMAAGHYCGTSRLVCATSTRRPASRATPKRVLTARSLAPLQESSSILPPWLEDVFSATTNLLPGSKDSSTRAVAPELLGAKVQINHCAQVKNPHSEFARQVLRQVATLPGGMPMGKLLTAADAIMRTAEATCDSAQQAAVVHSYVKLSINDIIQDAWQKRRQQLATDPVQDTSNATYQQDIFQANMALSGCAYLRIHAAAELAKRAHLLLDGQGTCATLNLSAMPAPHTTGIDWCQLLQEGLGVDVDNPSILKVSEAQVEQLQHMSFDKYFEKLADPTLCGEWQYTFFGNDATFSPAPFGKFGTKQLEGLLTPELMLSSLHNGVLGRALLAAAGKVGLQVDCTVVGGGDSVAVQPLADRLGSATAFVVKQAQRVVSRANIDIGKVKVLAVAMLATAASMLHQQHH